MRARLSLPAKRTPRSAFGKLVLNEFRLAWRQPLGLIFGLGLPVLLLVIFGSLPKFHEHLKTLGGLTAFDVHIPGSRRASHRWARVWSLPGPLATYREQGILRRLSTTPVPPAWVLVAQLLVNV